MSFNHIYVCFFALCVFLYTNCSGLIIRASVFGKKIDSHNVKIIALCGDDHVVGTPSQNLEQFYGLLKNIHRTKESITILAENQRATSLWFNDQFDQKLVNLLQRDILCALPKNEIGTFSMLFLLGMPPHFFPAYYRPLIEKTHVANIECRQFLYYTALLNNKLIQNNLINPYNIREFKKIQKQKCLHLTLQKVFDITKTIESYKNNTHNAQAKQILTSIYENLKYNTNALQNHWHKNIPLKSHTILNRPLWEVHQENQRSTPSYFNPFDDLLCPTLLESQFCDEMIEANALWHITQSTNAAPIIVVTGSVHTGQLFALTDHKTGLAAYLKQLGYKELASFGIEDPRRIDNIFCAQLSKKIPQFLCNWVKNGKQRARLCALL